MPTPCPVAPFLPAHPCPSYFVTFPWPHPAAPLPAALQVEREQEYILLITTYCLLMTTYSLLHTPYSLLPTTYYLLLTTCYLLPTTYLLLAAYYVRLRSTTYYLQSSTYYSLLTIYHLILTTCYLLRTTHYLLLTTYYLVLTTHYSLLTTYYLLLRSSRSRSTCRRLHKWPPDRSTHGKTRRQTTGLWRRSIDTLKVVRTALSPGANSASSTRLRR